MAQATNLEKIRIVESLLCASADALSASFLALLLNCTSEEIKQLVIKLNAAYKQQERAFEIIQLQTGYQLRTLPQYAHWVQRLTPSKKPFVLARGALETLAVVAYRQPVTRLEIEKLRGVDSAGSLRSLLDKHLIRIAGRDNKLGRPILYRTTPHFLSAIGLLNLKDLPALEEFQQQGQLAISE